MVVLMSGKDSSEDPATGNEIAGLPQQHGPRLYPVAAAAHELGISERKVWTLILGERLRTVWLDGRRLVPAAALDEFVAGLPDAKPDMHVVTA